MSNNPISGIGYFLHGLSLITQSRIRRFVIIPLIINITVFAVLISVGYAQLGGLIEYLQSFLPDWLSFLSFLLYPLFALASILVLVFGFSIVANLIAAPFNGFLAEAVENKLTGKPINDQNTSNIVKEIVTSVISEIGKLAYFALWAIPLLILFVIPVLQAAAPLLWFVFGAWMLALEYGDFPMGNHGIKFAHQRGMAASKRLTVLGFGAAVMFALMIPIVNFLVIPAAVAGATAMWVKEFSADHGA